MRREIDDSVSPCCTFTYEGLGLAGAGLGLGLVFATVFGFGFAFVLDFAVLVFGLVVVFGRDDDALEREPEDVVTFGFAEAVDRDDELVVVVVFGLLVTAATVPAEAPAAAVPATEVDARFGFSSDFTGSL